MKKLLSIVLALTMIFSLTVLPVHADVVEGEGTLTITPSITSAEAGADAIEVTYTIKVTPPEGKKVGGFSFKLSAPEGMSLPTKFKDGGATKIAYLNKGELEYSQEEETGIFENYSYTPSTGTFIANGTEASRMMETEYEILKIVTTIEAGKAGSFTLTAPDFEIYPNGTDKYTPKVVTTPVVVKAAVTDIPVESVSLDKTELKLAKGGNAKLTATVLPADATDKTVTWTTSKDKVAAVAADGTVTAVGEGTAVITATAGGKTAQCTVTVVNCLHTSKSLVAAKAATCTEKGMKEHYKCDTCSALFETETSTTPVEASALETPMIAHTFTDVAEKAATCTEKGNVAYKHCSTCGKNYDAEGKLLDTVETDALGHDMTFMTAVPATCKDTGTKAYFHCERCTKNFVDQNGQGELTDLTTDKDPTNHAGGTELVNVKAPSHVNKEDGYTGDTKCLGCGKIIAKGETISWGTHVWSDWKHDADKHWKECTVKGCTEKNEEAAHQPEAGTPNCVSSATCQVCGYVVAKSNPDIHTKIVKVEAKAATCTEDGNIEHYKCTGCGKLFSDEAGATGIAAKDVVIPAAHKLTPVAEKPSTCRVNGTGAYNKCEVCGKMFDKDTNKEITAVPVLELAAHTWDDVWHANSTGHYHECTVCGIAGDVTAHTPGAEATETTPQTCTVCGYIIKPATSHKEHTKGNLMSDATSHWYACTGCSEQLEKANHTVTSWTVDKAATTTEEGLRHGNCSVCQHVVYEKLAKINNTPVNPSKPGRPSGTKTVQSGKTFDAGVGVYVGLSILSLTGSAVVIGKKRKTR